MVQLQRKNKKNTMRKIYTSLLVVLVGFLPLFLKNNGSVFTDVLRTEREEIALRGDPEPSREEYYYEAPPEEETPVEETPSQDDYYYEEDTPIEEETPADDPSDTFDREDAAAEDDIYDYYTDDEIEEDTTSDDEETALERASTNETQEREAGCIAEGYLSCEDRDTIYETTPSRDETTTSRDETTTSREETTTSRDAIPTTRETTTSRDSTTSRKTTTSRDSTTTSREENITTRDNTTTSRDTEIASIEAVQNREEIIRIQREFTAEIEQKLIKRDELPVYNQDNEKTIIRRDTTIQVVPNLIEAEKEIRDSLRRNIDPSDNVVITTSTDSDDDGINDITENGYGTDAFSTDTDDDGISDNDEVLVYNSNPLKAEKVDRTPAIATITNLAGNKTTGSYPLVKGISKPGEKITITATQDHKTNTKICETESDEQGVFTCQTSKELKNGDYYLYANPKKEIKITVAEKENEQEIIVEVKETPKVLTVLKNTQKILNVYYKILGTDMTEIFYRAPLEKLLSTQTTVQKLIGQSDPDTNVIITWKSTTISSTVLADANQGNFEAKIPDKMRPGHHTILVYVYNKKLNSISNIKKISFFKS